MIAMSGLIDREQFLPVWFMNTGYMQLTFVELTSWPLPALNFDYWSQKKKTYDPCHMLEAHLYGQKNPQWNICIWIFISPVNATLVWVYVQSMYSVC